MRNATINKVKRGLNWKEKIIVKLFYKTFIKVVDISRDVTIKEIAKWFI